MSKPHGGQTKQNVLLQGIFSTQGLNPGLPHFGQTLYRLSHQGTPKKKTKQTNKQNWEDLLNHKRPEFLIQWIVGGACKFAFLPGSQVILMLLSLWTREQLT